MTVFTRACCFACIALSGCASSASSDAGPDSNADVASDTNPDALAHCYEIFVSGARYADGGVVPDSGGQQHSNPLAYEFGSITVGATATTDIRYYNFCADPAAMVLGTEIEPESESSSFTVTPPSPGPVSPEVTWSVAFHPMTPGEHRMTVRVQTNAGAYETDLHGSGE